MAEEGGRAVSISQDTLSLHPIVIGRRPCSYLNPREFSNLVSANRDKTEKIWLTFAYTQFTF